MTGKILKPYGYSVEHVKLHPDILHHDCTLGFVKEELMLVCEDASLKGIP
jgi:N-dimethylarginine dimethylaminohydrolase